ncbi:hypothetical protein [Haloarcula sp. CGMCC 1.2071]|uniref:hypothetical protein n=1 Tax=Haloarcula sp. CGMCC 1.2071 TaxID=3111454 RepID=UPI00300F6F8F
MQSGSRNHWRWIAILLVMYGIVLFRGLDYVQTGLASVGLLIAIDSVARRTGVNPTVPLAAFGVFAALIHLNAVGQFLPGLPDADTYHGLSRYIAQQLAAGTIPSPPHIRLRVNAFVYVVGAIYFVIGENRLLIGLLSAGCWSVSILYWMRIAKLVAPDRMAATKRQFATAVGVLMMGVPATVNLMRDVLREPVAMLSLTLCCWLLLKWTRRRKHRHLVYAPLTLLPAALVRPEVFAVVLVAASCTVAFVVAERNGQTIPALTTLALTGAVLFTYVTSMFNFLALEWLNGYRQHGLYSYRNGEAYIDPKAYLLEMEYETWFDVILFLPIRAFYFLLTPFPWKPENYSAFVSTVDGTYQLLLVPLALFGGAYVVREWDWEHVILFGGIAALTIAGYATIVSAGGTATRRRIFATPVIALFAAYFLSRSLRVALEVPDWLRSVTDVEPEARMDAEGTYVRIWQRSRVGRTIGRYFSWLGRQWAPALAAARTHEIARRIRVGVRQSRVLSIGRPTRLWSAWAGSNLRRQYVQPAVASSTSVTMTASVRQTTVEKLPQWSRSRDVHQIRVDLRDATVVRALEQLLGLPDSIRTASTPTLARRAKRYANRSPITAALVSAAAITGLNLVWMLVTNQPMTVIAGRGALLCLFSVAAAGSADEAVQHI